MIDDQRLDCASASLRQELHTCEIVTANISMCSDLTIKAPEHPHSNISNKMSGVNDDTGATLASSSFLRFGSEWIFESHIVITAPASLNLRIVVNGRGVCVYN